MRKFNRFYCDDQSSGSIGTNEEFKQGNGGRITYLLKANSRKIIAFKLANFDGEYVTLSDKYVITPEIVASDFTDGVEEIKIKEYNNSIEYYSLVDYANTIFAYNRPFAVYRHDDALTEGSIIVGNYSQSIVPYEIFYAGRVGYDVDENEIVDGAVTTNKIGDNAVTTPKILDNAVTTDKVGNSQITTNKINNSAVTTDKINNSAITDVKINASAVTESKIATGSVTETKIGTGAVTNTKIGTSAVTETKIADDAITNLKIADNAVSGAIIADDGVNKEKINESGMEFIGSPVSRVADAVFTTSDNIASLAGYNTSTKTFMLEIPAGQHYKIRKTMIIKIESAEQRIGISTVELSTDNSNFYFIQQNYVDVVGLCCVDQYVVNMATDGIDDRILYIRVKFKEITGDSFTNITVTCSIINVA